VNLYDVMADGYHTPLTKTQIAELFHAGRLGRDQPCKQVEKKDWRTIDELFPLLKYNSSGPVPYENSDSTPLSPNARTLTLLLLVSVLVTLALLSYFFTRSTSDDSGRGLSRTSLTKQLPAGPTAQESYVSSNIAPSPASVLLSEEQSSGVLVVQPTSSDASRQSLDAEKARLAQERLRAEHGQRQQAQAAQDRVNAEARERERQKAAGRDVIAPYDQFTLVPNLGGSDVVVKIHDADVASIDVWINYSRPVRITKQKGISGSRTDETLIYSTGRAKLYYVWEISGTLNHCLLRVRDE